MPFGISPDKSARGRASGPGAGTPTSRADRPTGKAWASFEADGIVWEGEVAIVGGGIELPARLVLTSRQLALVSSGQVVLDVPRTWLRPAAEEMGQDALRVSITPEGRTAGLEETDHLPIRIRAGRAATRQLAATLVGTASYAPSPGNSEVANQPAGSAPAWAGGIGAATPMALPPLPEFGDDEPPAKQTWPPIEQQGIPAPGTRSRPPAVTAPASSSPSPTSEDADAETPPAGPSRVATTSRLAHRRARTTAIEAEEANPVVTFEPRQVNRGLIWGLRLSILLVLVSTALYFGRDRLYERLDVAFPANVEERLGLRQDTADISQIPAASDQAGATLEGTTPTSEPTSAPPDGSGQSVPSDGTSGGELQPVQETSTAAPDEEGNDGPGQGDSPTEVPGVPPVPTSDPDSDEPRAGVDEASDDLPGDAPPEPTAPVVEVPPPTATEPPTEIPTERPTETPRATATEVPTEAPTEVPTRTPAPSATATVTPTVGPTQTPAPTPTATEAPTRTPAPTATATPTAETTQTPAPTATVNPTQTPASTATATSTQVPTRTPAPSATATATVDSTQTPAPTTTATPTGESTQTPAATATPTVNPTQTPAPTATDTATATPAPSQPPAQTPTVVPETVLESQPPSVDPETPPAQSLGDGAFRYAIEGAARGDTIEELPDVNDVGDYGEWVVISLYGENWTASEREFDMSQFRLVADGKEILLDVGNGWVSSQLGLDPAYGNTDTVSLAPGEGHRFALTFLVPQGAESLVLYAGEQAVDLEPVLAQPAPLAIPEEAPALPEFIEATVVGAENGETIVIERDGVRQTVRYLGVDAPTGDDCFAEEATAANAELVVGKRVRIERQATATDARGNLVRDVWVEADDGRFVLASAALVTDGALRAGISEPNTRFAGWLTGSESAARAEGRGQWSACEPEAMGAPGSVVTMVGTATRGGALRGPDR